MFEGTQNWVPSKILDLDLHNVRGDPVLDLDHDLHNVRGDPELGPLKNT